jgi:hypothetical protein
MRSSTTSYHLMNTRTLVRLKHAYYWNGSQTLRKARWLCPGSLTGQISTLTVVSLAPPIANFLEGWKVSLLIDRADQYFDSTFISSAVSKLPEKCQISMKGPG